MRLKRTAVLVACIMHLCAIISFAQKGPAQISGQVKDTKGVGIPSVTIVVKGTKRSTQSDAEGKFTIEVPAGKVLLFSSVGYGDKEVVAGSGNNLSIVLTEAAKGLEDMVVVGYGAQKRKDLTGAVSSVNSDHMNLGGTTVNVGQAIQGRAAGVQVQQSDFSPGAG